MRLFLEPTETVLFRTGRPFDAGESSYAETLFPPTPETLQGAIRATIATYWDSSLTPEEVFQQEELVNLIGNRSSYGRFRITSLSVGRRTQDGTIERIFPAPLHLLEGEETKEGVQPQYLIPHKLPGVQSDLSDSGYYLSPSTKREEKLEPFDSWLTEQGLYKVLRSQQPLMKQEIVRLKEIYRFEPRLGIGMDNAAKASKEGLLYQTRMIRMQPEYGFVADVRLCQQQPLSDLPTASFSSLFIPDEQTQKKLRLPDTGWVQLGGERRIARFEVLSSLKEELPHNVEQTTEGNLLYLATPAALKGGWQPEQWGVVTPFVSPIAAAINHYQLIGGWALNPGESGGKNKIMRRCVPAGSVYFFDQAVSVTQPLTDYGMEIGFGIIYTGEWKKP